jgi:transcriptional regulator with XRE-family HTH domain
MIESKSVIIDAPTKRGCLVLGNLLKRDREALNWSQDEVVLQIFATVRVRSEDGQLCPYRVTRATISDLERGRNLEPKTTLLEAIAAVGYVIHPSGRAFTGQELRAITQERLDPLTGTRIESFDDLSHSSKLSVEWAEAATSAA